MYDIIEIGMLRQNLAMLSRRAATDRDFRILCIEDANKAYLELTGLTMPEWCVIHFIEQEQEIPHGSTAQWMRLPQYLSKTWLG